MAGKTTSRGLIDLSTHERRFLPAGYRALTFAFYFEANASLTAKIGLEFDFGEICVPIVNLCLSLKLEIIPYDVYVFDLGAILEKTKLFDFCLQLEGPEGNYDENAGQVAPIEADGTCGNGNEGKVFLGPSVSQLLPPFLRRLDLFLGLRMSVREKIC